jgi:hypothetical protein
MACSGIALALADLLEHDNALSDSIKGGEMLDQSGFSQLLSCFVAYIHSLETYNLLVLCVDIMVTFI